MMHPFTKKDFVSSVVTGLTTGFIAWRILDFLKTPDIFGVPIYSLVLIVPILWIMGVMLGYFLGQWIGFFNQFGRFAAVGFANAAVDYGVLNLLVAASSITAGLGYSAFKTLSFIVAMFHSYFWNKVWVFEAGNENSGREFGSFAVVTVISILINVGVASFVVNVIGPLWGLSAEAWVNIGAVAGSAIALAFSFIGFKLVVFKKSVSDPPAGGATSYQ